MLCLSLVVLKLSVLSSLNEKKSTNTLAAEAADVDEQSLQDEVLFLYLD